jgi:hypothetical protein
VLDAALPAPGPPLVAPPPRLAVAAVGDELEIGAVGDGRGVDPERGQVDHVGWPLVVVGPGLGVGAHHERATLHQHLIGVGRRRGRRWRVQADVTVPLGQLEGGQHGLVVLVLVLDDHAVHEAAGHEGEGRIELDALEQAQGPVPHLGQVGPGLARGEEGQGRAIGPGVAEGVVEVVARRAHAGCADGPHQPEVLVVAHVGQVPHQR